MAAPELHLYFDRAEPPDAATHGAAFADAYLALTAYAGQDLVQLEHAEVVGAGQTLGVRSGAWDKPATRSSTTMAESSVDHLASEVAASAEEKTAIFRAIAIAFAVADRNPATRRRTDPVDVLVTPWAHRLRSLPRGAQRELAYVDPVFAHRLVGVHLVGDRTYTTPGMTYSDVSYYWMAARHLLRNYATWRGGCCRSTALLEMADGFISRVRRALRARDEAAVEWTMPTGPGMVEVGLERFDTFLVQFCGAFDVLSRVANEAYGLGQSPDQSKWQRAPFRTGLRAEEADLADFMESNQLGGRVFQVLRDLRNTVHEAPIKEFLLIDGGGFRPTAFVPPNTLGRLEQALGPPLSGAETFGVIGGDRPRLELFQLMESLTQLCLATLDQLLARFSMSQGAAPVGPDDPRLALAGLLPQTGLSGTDSFAELVSRADVGWTEGG